MVIVNRKSVFFFLLSACEMPRIRVYSSNRRRWGNVDQPLRTWLTNALPRPNCVLLCVSIYDFSLNSKYPSVRIGCLTTRKIIRERKNGAKGIRVPRSQLVIGRDAVVATKPFSSRLEFTGSDRCEQSVNENN